MPISDITETLPLVDHHCHGLFPVDLDDERLADSLSEAFAPAPPGTDHWDKPVALSLRRRCAPLLTWSRSARRRRMPSAAGRSARRR